MGIKRTELNRRIDLCPLNYLAKQVGRLPLTDKLIQLASYPLHAYTVIFRVSFPLKLQTRIFVIEFSFYVIDKTG